MNLESIPGCFGYYPKALKPNDCSICEAKELCQKVVAKESLKLILEEVGEAKAILKGEK